MKTLDCRGLACPRPVIITKKELESMELGEFEVIVDNEAAKENVSKFAKNLGVTYKVSEKDGFYYIVLNKEENAEAQILCDVDNRQAPIQIPKNLVIVVSSDKLGAGEDKLGEALMKSYIYALSESEHKPSTLMFLNGGVKLTTEGSGVIESLKILENSGTTIFACGTCLDFYGLKDKLLIGSITNMYTIVEKMNEATNTIKL